jgi:DNA-binding CsgD family transcriptional regulator
LFQVDFRRAAAAIEEGKRRIAGEDDRWTLAYLLVAQSYLCFFEGDPHCARRWAQESVALFAADGDDVPAILGRLCLASVALADHSIGEARHWGEESLALAGKAEDLWLSSVAQNALGAVAFHEGDRRSALTHFQESIAGLRRLGETWTLAFAIEGAVLAAGERAGDERTARLLGAAAQLRELVGAPLPGRLPEALDHAVVGLRTSLGEPAFSTAWAAGKSMSLDAVIDETTALGDISESKRETPRQSVAGLTERELEVLRLVAAGLTAPQIAERLFLSPRTVHTHLAAIYRKLDVNTRGEAVRFAVEQGLA